MAGEASSRSAVASASSSRLMVLMFTDVVGSVELKNKLGTIEYAARLSEHDAIFRELVRSCHEAEILTDTGDGFFACFASASDAVRTALLFQQRIAAKRGPLRVRIGLHVGEVTRMFGGAGDRSKVVGLAADIASRVMECAQGGQILLTRFPFDEARQFIQAHPPIDDTRVPELCWIAHGEYVFKGSDQPIAVFEVGAVGIAPLSPPTDQASVRRAIRPGDELTLGWRPAGGLELPGQAQWIIREKLGEGGFGEVWLAEHDKTHKRRVLKFCFEPERVRGLKREVVLFRLLTEALGDRRDIARIIDFKFDEAPYFVESEYVAGGSLPEWAARHGGMAGVPLNPRLQIVAQVSTALSAAHSVGVLHKDIKPTNVLMSTETLDAHAILTDFGIGILTDPSQLRKRDITLADLTNTLLSGNESSRTGTRMYAPPESLTNRPFTVQGDVYALGVLLYQMVIGDLSRPLAEGWERDVTDSLLRSDIAACVDGDPSKRLGSASELAMRLGTLDARRAQAQREQDLVRNQARRKQLLKALVALLIVALASAIMLAVIARERTRRIDAVQRERDRAVAVTDFLRDMLVAADPARANRRDITVREVIDAAAARIEPGLKDQPQAEAGVRAALGRTYLTLGLYPQAETQLKKAVELSRANLGEADRLTLKALNDLAALYLYTGQFELAEQTSQKALDARRKAFGSGDPDVAESLHNLGLIYGETRQFEKSRVALREALAIREKAFGAESEPVAASLQYLALYTGAAGDYADAERDFQRSLAIREKVLAPNHFEIGTSHNNLALVYMSAGELGRAEEHFNAALKIFEKALPPDHPNVATVWLNLAAIQVRRENYDAAMEPAQRALSIREKSLPPDHPDLAMALHIVATVHYARKDYEQAARGYEQALRIQEKATGPDNAFTLQIKRVLALVYRDAHRCSDAEVLFMGVIDGYTRTRQPAEVVQTKLGLYEGYLWQGHYEKMEPLAVALVDEAHSVPGVVQEKFVTDSMRLVIQMYEGWGKPEKAAPYRNRLQTRGSGPARPSSAP